MIIRIITIRRTANPIISFIFYLFPFYDTLYSCRAQLQTNLSYLTQQYQIITITSR